jgi:hypothetical protein
LTPQDIRPDFSQPAILNQHGGGNFTLDINSLQNIIVDSLRRSGLFEQVVLAPAMESEQVQREWARQNKIDYLLESQLSEHRWRFVEHTSEAKITGSPKQHQGEIVTSINLLIKKWDGSDQFSRQSKITTYDCYHYPVDLSSPNRGADISVLGALHQGIESLSEHFAGKMIRDEKTKTAYAAPAVVSQQISSIDNQAGQTKRFAVVIGISEYKYVKQGGLNNLIYADDDAKAFARVLKSLGWSESYINLLVNEAATQRNIIIALESWLTKAGPNDQIVLFWAGHGFPDPEDPEKVYFACYDTDISIPATGYRMDKVRSILQEHKARNVIVFADTCHAGKLITRGDRGVSIVPNIEKMRREQNIPKGWIFMVGADTDRQAIEHASWTNGAFTHSLIKGLSGEADGFQSAGAKDGVVTMGELKDYMNTAMPDETQKVLGVAKRPVITTSTGDPDIWSLTLKAK